MIYVNKAAGITRPQDLAGKQIGELALRARRRRDAEGILSDEYGLRPEQCRWLVGGIDFTLKPVDSVSRRVPDGVEVDYAGSDVDLCS